MVLEHSIIVTKQRALADARPTVKQDEGWPGGIQAAKPQALGQTINGHKLHRRYASRNDVPSTISKWFGVDAARAAEEDCRHNQCDTPVEEWGERHAAT
jgi:hypothetical protein